MDNEGWWESDSVEVSVDKVRDAGESIEAGVTAFSKSRTNPLRRQTGEAEVSFSGASNTTHDDEADEFDAGEMDFEQRADYDHDRSEF